MATQTQVALKTAICWWLEHGYEIPLWPVNPVSCRFAEAVGVTRALL